MNFIGVGKAVSPIKKCNMHTHMHWELIYQIDHHTVATAGDGSFPMQAGDIIVIPPRVPHKTESDTYFTDMCILLKKCDFLTSPFVVRDRDGSILRLFEMIYLSRLDKTEFNEIITEKLSELVCIYIKKMAADAKEPRAVSDIKMLLKENLENADFKLTDALEKYGYNPDYLRRSFKKHTSLSPLSYLNSLRIEKAKELLVFEHFLSVDQVAARCGFNDSFYFSTAFKRHVGESPLKYKKKHEQGK